MSSQKNPWFSQLFAILSSFRSSLGFLLDPSSSLFCPPLTLALGVSQISRKLPMRGAERGEFPMAGQVHLDPEPPGETTGVTKVGHLVVSG